VHHTEHVETTDAPPLVASVFRLRVMRNAVTFVVAVIGGCTVGWLRLFMHPTRREWLWYFQLVPAVVVVVFVGAVMARTAEMLRRSMRSLRMVDRTGSFLDARAFVGASHVDLTRRPPLFPKIVETFFLAFYSIDDGVRREPLFAVRVHRSEAIAVDRGRVVAVFGSPEVDGHVVVAWEHQVVDHAPVVQLPAGVRPTMGSLDWW
jgi:hypothetical protein